ncbi:MAG: hypothetical protein Q9218_000133 [Villophora microphyllina]
MNMATAGSNKPATTGEEVVLNECIERLQRQIETSLGYKRLLKANLAALHATSSTTEMRVNVMALELEKEELTDQLRRLRSGEIKALSSAEREAMEAELAEWRRKAQARKKIFGDMWAVARAAIPEVKTKEELWEELGLENDDDERDSKRM